MNKVTKEFREAIDQYIDTKWGKCGQEKFVSFFEVDLELPMPGVPFTPIVLSDKFTITDIVEDDRVEDYLLPFVVSVDHCGETLYFLFGRGTMEEERNKGDFPYCLSQVKRVKRVVEVFEEVRD